MGVVGLGTFGHHPLQLLLPLLLPFLPPLLLLLSLLPLLQRLSTQGDNLVTDAGRFGWDGTSGEQGQEIQDGSNNQLGGVEAVLEGAVRTLQGCWEKEFHNNSAFEDFKHRRQLLRTRCLHGTSAF